MNVALRLRSRGAASWRSLLIALATVAALAIAGAAASTASAETVWLCKPGMANNPCESSEETTVEFANGSTYVEHPKPAANPPIDCFYVYPTVSSYLGGVNAPDKVEPEETQIAIDQASRFSQQCKVYAPIYPQLTLAAINTPGAITKEADETAYIGVLFAFEEYLAVYNHGRPFVLIGHSQGSAMLEQLIKEQIDQPQDAALRSQLVSAIILGGQVLVPKGKTEGATFQNVPTCGFVLQTGCVVAYSSFLKEPPEDSLFGRVNSTLLGGTIPPEVAKTLEVACVNPASAFLSAGFPGPLLRYESTSPFPGFLGEYVKGAKGTTPWVAMPGQYSGQCDRANGATWLNLSPAGGPGDVREPITEILGPTWGTHLEDVNVALGNLVGLVGLQGEGYQLLHH